MFQPLPIVWTKGPELRRMHGPNCTATSQLVMGAQRPRSIGMETLFSGLDIVQAVTLSGQVLRAKVVKK